MHGRDGVKIGLNIPSKAKKRNMTEAEMEEHAKHTSAWVQAGMAADAKQKGV
jgi:hypothetical protein